MTAAGGGGSNLILVITKQVGIVHLAAILNISILFHAKIEYSAILES
jgi:hypothetical protein